MGQVEDSIIKSGLKFSQKKERMRVMFKDGLSKSTKKALKNAGITTTEQLRKSFDEAEIRGIRNIGIVSYNEICQYLKKFESIRYSVDSLTCNVCKGKLTPVRWQNDDKEWLFGYLCSCTEKHRGKIGLDYAI